MGSSFDLGNILGKRRISIEDLAKDIARRIADQPECSPADAFRAMMAAQHGLGVLPFLLIPGEEVVHVHE